MALDLEFPKLDLGDWVLDLGRGINLDVGSWFLDLVSRNLNQMHGSWIMAHWTLEVRTWAFGLGSWNLALGSWDLSVRLEYWLFGLRSWIFDTFGFGS